MKKNPVSIPHTVWYADDIRRGEREAADVLGLTLYELMLRAGEAAFQVCRSAYPDARHWLVLCGHGNNGGDGYVVARLAKAVGIEVTLLAQESDKPLPEEAALAREAWLNAGGEIDPERDRIIEIATLVTDANLNILAEGPTIAVHQSDEQLALMDDWNVRTHTASGLVERVKASTMGDREAELATLEFLKQWVPAGKSPICGNSIGQDRRFLFKYMPELEAYFHYRYLDVSTLKELARRWKPEILDGFTKQGTHQAMDDIRESVAELAYYREHFIKL